MVQHFESQLHFAGVSIDLDRGRITRDGQDVVLRRKSFSVLTHLIKNQDRVVPKEELLKVVWPNLFVTDESLAQCIRDIRQALGAEGATAIRTLPRRGYLFALPRETENAGKVSGRVGLSSETERVNPSSEAPAALHTDGIAVLPFTISGTIQSQSSHLIDGLVHDVISRLARLRSFRVIARGSTFAVRHLASQPQTAGRQFGVTYVVAGAATTSDTDIVIQYDIIVVDSGELLWTETLSYRLQDFREAVGVLSERIVQKTNLEATKAEIKRALRSDGRNLNAWQSYHMGLHDTFRFDPSRLPVALSMFERAVQLDPSFARAYAAQSFCHSLHAFLDFSDDRPKRVAATLRTAEEAMLLDDSNPSSQWSFGRALWLSGDPAGALSHLRSAVNISPSYAMAYYFLGFLETLYGSPASGLQQLKTCMTLSPLDPFAPAVECMLAMTHVRLGNLDEAAASAERSTRYPNAHVQILAPSSLILAEAGNMDVAHKLVDRVREISPSYSASELERTLYDLPDDLRSLFRRNAKKMKI